MCREWMCVLTLLFVEELAVTNSEKRTEDGAVTDSSSQGASAFSFCSLEAECETLMKSNLHLWVAMKRLALFDAPEKPWPHTAGSKNSAHPITNPAPNPLPFTLRPPGIASLLLLASGYSRIVLCSQEHLL